MSTSPPATEDLETFLAIAQLGTLTGAADHLRLPKSTISRRLARLEHTLQARLFVRNRQRLTLSEAGTALLGPARASLDALRELVDAASLRQQAPSGRLRVSIPQDLISQHTLWLSFAQRYPDVALALEPTNRYVDPVSERYDLALRAGRGPDDTLVAQHIGHYALIAVASPDYVARWGKLEAASDLRRHSCILLHALAHRPGHPDHPEPPHRHIICPDERLALSAALHGLGVAILREDAVADAVAAGALLPVLDAYNPLRIPLFAVYPERAYLRPAVVAFIEHVRDALSAPPTPPAATQTEPRPAQAPPASARPPAPLL